MIEWLPYSTNLKVSDDSASDPGPTTTFIDSANSQKDLKFP